MYIFIACAFLTAIFFTRRWWLPYALAPLRPLLLRYWKIVAPIATRIVVFIAQKISKRPIRVEYDLLPGGKVVRYALALTDQGSRPYYLLVRFDSDGPELTKVLAHYDNGDIKNITQPGGLVYDFSPRDIRASKVEIYYTDILSGEEKLVSVITNEEKIQLRIQELDLD